VAAWQSFSEPLNARLRIVTVTGYVNSLGHDALAAEFARLLVDDIAVADVVLIKRNSGMAPAQQQLHKPSLRSSIGKRRKSCPSSSSKSKAQSTAAWSRRKERSSSKTASPSSSLTMTSPSIRHERAGSRNRRRNERESCTEIVAVTAVEPHVGGVAPRHDAEAVVLDLARPGPLRGALAGNGGQGSTKPIARPLRCNMVLYFSPLACWRGSALVFSTATILRGSACRICRLACRMRSRARLGSIRCSCLMVGN
jgi:hypothetical protein